MEKLRIKIHILNHINLNDPRINVLSSRIPVVKWFFLKNKMKQKYKHSSLNADMSTK